MLFERDEDYREIRGYHELSGGHRPGYMAVGEKLRISDANLSRLDTTAANLAEMRHAILEEKVRAILSAISNEYPDDVFERLIREERFPETFTQISARETTVPDHAYSTGEIARTFANAGAEERIILCRGLAHANDRMYRITEGEYDDRWVRMISDLVREEDHIEDDTTPDLEARVPRPVGERVAYLRNTYTDTAFETFSTVLRSAASTYYSDFPGVCEALYYDRATACILPLENSSDGKLLRFYSLLTRYDLRIAYVTSVTAYDIDITPDSPRPAARTAIMNIICSTVILPFLIFPYLFLPKNKTVLNPFFAIMYSYNNFITNDRKIQHDTYENGSYRRYGR